MGWYSDECLQITDQFEFDHKKEFKMKEFDNKLLLV